jgi:hypothetical protein
MIKELILEIKHNRDKNIILLIHREDGAPVCHKNSNQEPGE